MRLSLSGSLLGFKPFVLLVKCDFLCGLSSSFYSCMEWTSFSNSYPFIQLCLFNCDLFCLIVVYPDNTAFIKQFSKIVMK